MKLNEYTKKILLFLIMIIERMWICLKITLLFLFRVFIRWENNHKTLSIIENGLTIFGFVSLIYLMVMPFYYY